MALVDDKSSYLPPTSHDAGIQQLWNLVLQLSEQLSHNRACANALYQLVANTKSQAIHSKTGFVFRKYNPHVPRESFDAELERMNDGLSGENQILSHDNKHLGLLIKEYEQTLENLMSTFRNRAREVQDRELSIIREYESKLLALEEDNSQQDLIHDTKISESIARLSHLLRQCMRLHNGEEPLETPLGLLPALCRQDVPGNLFYETLSLSSQLEAREKEEKTLEDIALERECELARLEKENEELRRLIGLLPATMRNPRSGSGAYDRFGGFGRAGSQQRLGVNSSPGYGAKKSIGV